MLVVSGSKNALLHWSVAKKMPPSISGSLEKIATITLVTSGSKNAPYISLWWGEDCPLISLVMGRKNASLHWWSVWRRMPHYIGGQ